MSVYVDASIYGYGRMVMCHMIADTPEELHAMADRIGVARKWFQDPARGKASFWHYDIAKSKRSLAVEAGAIECDRNEFVAAVRRIRASGTFLRAATALHRCARCGATLSTSGDPAVVESSLAVHREVCPGPTDLPPATKVSQLVDVLGGDMLPAPPISSPGDAVSSDQLVEILALVREDEGN